MLVSYDWLQSYFEHPLPEAGKLAELFTLHFSEVEGIEKKGSDTIFDLNILPDRAHYALSHRGVAKELAAALGLPVQIPERAAPPTSKAGALSIEIENQNDCARYMGRRVEGIVIGTSPDWLIKRLAAIGQRSINNVVDAANYVMFDTGQPLHAFDASKVKGGIRVRRAKKGERLELLKSEKVIEGGVLADWKRTGYLDESFLIIADDEGPLGIAGIKGGARAAVGPETKSLILEAAHFNPALLRRTSQRLDLRTDASKRFENEPAPELAATAMEEFSSLLAEVFPQAKFGKVVDEYPSPPKPRTVPSSPEFIAARLGIPVAEKEVVKILARLEIKTKKEKDGSLSALVPPERLDLAIPEDIAEEVGRLVGYDKIPATLPPKTKTKAEIPKQLYWEWKIRELLVSEGFSEVMTSSFSEKGVVAIEKPLAEDKSFARPALRGSFSKALELNARNVPLFGAEEARIFEIGKVFPKEGERTALALGYAGLKKKGKSPLAEIRKLLEEKLGATLEGEERDGVFETGLDAIMEKLPEAQKWDMEFPPVTTEKFQPFSPYPFIVRDVALFVPSGTSPEEILACIRQKAGQLAVRSWKFDEFEKNGKQSFAFRVVFQSFEKTLTDAEANMEMEKIYTALKKKFSAEIR